MTFQQKDNSGALFVNDRKESDKHPDRTGTAMIDGREYYVSGWLKKGAKGTFLSLAFKPKEAKQGKVTFAPNARQRAEEYEEETPF